MSRAVEIVPYRDEWPQEFARLSEPMRKALGETARRIDHIGSTSVPGLASKDRIDLMITVADFSPATMKALDSALSPLGWEISPYRMDHIPPGWTGDPSEWEKRYFHAANVGRAANLHVRMEGRANQRYALLFRDYLRAHPAAAEAYAELKRRLSVQVGEEREAYVDIKDPVCDLVMVGAEAWALATNWQPAPLEKE